MDGNDSVRTVSSRIRPHPPAPRNIRRRHFLPSLTAFGITGIRQHDFRRTYIALHVDAGTHPTLVQERVGYSSIGLTMDLYGKIAGHTALAAEQEARFEALNCRGASRVCPGPTGRKFGGGNRRRWRPHACQGFRSRKCHLTSPILRSAAA